MVWIKSMKAQVFRIGVGLAGAVLFLLHGTASAEVVTVQVGVQPASSRPAGKNGYTNPNLVFTPSVVSVKTGDATRAGETVVGRWMT
jgi:hypothetical protein